MGRKPGVALYGCGNVGSGLVHVLHALERAEPAHVDTVELRHVVVRDIAKPRQVTLQRSLLTHSLRAPLADPDVDIVVELMGGLEPALSVILGALRAGKHVVTANKAVLAHHGLEIERTAHEHGVLLRYEAAAAGAIPIIQALREPLASAPISRIRGIINGTTNFILTRMLAHGWPFARALSEAQSLGFAEADPSADVSGRDAAQKLVLLARHAFGTWIPLERVAIQGIDNITEADVADARRHGEAIRLIAEAARTSDGATLAVAPARVPPGDPLHAISNETNAVIVESEFAGSLLFAGPGAGGRPTGSAVYSDLMSIARHVRARRRERAWA